MTIQTSRSRKISMYGIYQSFLLKKKILVIGWQIYNWSVWHFAGYFKSYDAINFKFVDLGLTHLPFYIKR